ncbi:SIS domain-containing protein, partial [Candidatus Bathyarchaeota archaeon]|nr:SIS domain-containing protein [Candidatus Bathyarchaeota archaeon]
MQTAVKAHLDGLFQRYSLLADIRHDIVSTFEISAGAFRNGKRLFVCGNGGSAADSEHIVGELIKGFLSPRRLSAEAGDSIAEACDAADAAQYLRDNLQY